MAARRTFLKKLREVIRGQVIADEQSLGQFSRDQSIYEIKPLVVVLPEDAEDVGRIVTLAAREGVPLTARGGGSGTAGAALGEGIVMALPKNEFWGRISGYSSNDRSARVSCGAGVYHNDLQKHLRARGLFLPADVTSAEISRLGGNIATRASGPHALKYGSIDGFLESLEFITTEGRLVDTADEATIPERFQRQLADLEQRIKANEKARGILEARQGLKTSSGYDLAAFLCPLAVGPRIVRLLSGSVGTLGIITGAVLRAEVYERERMAVLLYFDDLVAAGRAVNVLRKLDVAAIELISRETFHVLRGRTPLAVALDKDAHLLFVELTGPKRREEARNLIARLTRKGSGMSAPPVTAVKESEIVNLWNLRRELLWLVEHPEPGFRALAVVNDVGVPPERLEEFVADVGKIFQRRGIIAPIYGHAGNGNLHLRPLFDMSRPGLRELIRRLADDVYAAVLRYGGTVTAEHGMGRLRAPYLEKEWGKALYAYMREVKEIFDPGGFLNPGAMFGAAPITDHMRSDLWQP